MKMPSLSNRAQQSHHSSSATPAAAVGSGADARSAVWTRSNTDDVNLGQLHKFWSELSSAQRRELLRVDKQTLFEQVRKNFYCSRCHGLLVEGFAQIMNGKNRHAGLLAYSNGGSGRHSYENGSGGAVASVNDDTRDPTVHSWGGLAATRDNMLTVLDCFLEGTPLEVFENARTRERERELLYPDACGGGGRGWMSQSIGNFGGNGRGHGMKETCALHTARLSCEALVDFWAALGEETRRSLLRMKEEDFIERLMFRFDSKRFCRDCRRNVLREFKEMKELKRTRKEPRCTRWFCAADTVFRYEVSDSVVHIDWQDCFAGDVGTVYQRFEWALGTGEGKCDILGFEDVGLSETVIVDGLDLASVSACHVTVRGWKRDGRSTELAAKAHALKGQLCVHRRLIVGDGIVSITKGESIQRFFERAEETEEEEDDDSMDKDGNDFDGEGSRPQKHAKSPELARDFLLDAATVIFKEQVEKAFREGTARQNAHSIFVCLALSLLEERVRVACKEIATLEKQNKLLEEEEDEKREEEERRERRKLKEKEKKLRKKEKLKEKERAKDKNKVEVKSPVIMSSGQVDAMSCASEEEQDCSTITQADGSSHVSDSTSARPSSPDMVDVRPSGDGSDSDSGSGKSQDFISHTSNVAESLSKRDGNGAFMVEKSKSSRRRLQLRKNQVAETSSNGSSHAPGDRVYICSSIRDGSDQRIVNRKGDTAMTEAHLYNGGLHNTKRVDIWGRTAPENQNRHDVHTQCACGSPQNGSRVKIHGQRIVARVGSKDSSSTKGAKREIIAAASASRPASRNVMDVPGTVGGKRVNVENLDASKGKTLGVARIVGQEGVRLQSKRDAETSDVCMQAHMRNATDNLSASSVSQDDVGASQQGSVNGDATSTGFSTVHNATQIDGVPSSPTPGKLAWVSNHVNGNLLAAPSIIRSSAAVCGHASINGSQHPKPLGSRILQSKPRWPNGVAVVPRSNGVAVSGSVTATATTSAQAVGGSAVACVSDEGPSESSVSSSTTEQPSSRLNGSHQPTGIHKVEDSNAGNSKLLVNTHSSSAPQGLSQKVGASARTSLHPVTSSLSTSSEPFEPESMRRQPFIKGAGGPRNGLSSDGKAVLVEANRVRPSLMGMSMTRAMEVPGHGQHLHAENVLVHNGSVLPPGMVVGAPHLHCNGGPQPSFPQGNRLRPMKSIFTSSAEILQMPPCGPVQIPSLHLHPGQQNFGFYPMQGPWGPRPRNGVLPLPQPGGYLISGPGAIGMPMGSLPPMSLPIPASLQPLPPGMAGPGHFQVPLPSGFRESARESTPFLSRYGARSNSGSADTRVVTSAAMQVLPAAQQDGAALLKAGEDAKQDRSVSPGHVDSTKFSTSAPTEPESSVQHGQHLNSESTNVSEKVGSNFSLFHFGGPSPAPAPQALEPDSAVHLSSAKDRKQATLTSTTSEPSVPEICRTRRCVDEHAVGTSVSELCTPGGEYSLFAAAPGKGFGFF